MKDKSLILLRGLPGSGKTTLALLLSQEGKFPCFSVDDFFTDPVSGKYIFDFSKNHMAYKRCESDTENAMKEGYEKIFVHNTFTMDWEMEPYFKLAAIHAYKLFVMTVEKHHNQNNVHEIPQEHLQKMAEKYKVKLL